MPHRVETERLVLRRYTHADAEALGEVTTRNVDHLRRYMEWIQFEPQSIEQRRALIDTLNSQADAGEDYTLGMFLHSGEFIGGTGYHVRAHPDRLELGYWIDRAQEGRGLVTEAAVALTLVALNLAGADIVDVAHAPSNERSASIPRRLGFVRQEAVAHGCFDDGQMHDGVMWWATRDHLTQEPFAAAPRPRAWGADGTEFAWPAERADA
ncbi:GNAT family N-acetyltransferase [Demequina flava]|uniref:GNAT family N-acetyltransferase n=1 Tax=Demequina flava TaxID=1095025 RepID=UPI001F32C9BE|nr:GNAT family N-acetyltransferase [Demequina flava]